MLRNYFLLNLLLILIIGALSFNLYNVISYTEAVPSESSVKYAPKAHSAVQRRDNAISEGAFDAISRMDLFNPSRSASLLKDKKVEKEPLKNPPKLFGTIILRENKTAILEDPETKTTKVYRINDSVAGYTVSDILEDKVILTGNGDKFEVKLRDEKGIKPPRRSAVRRPAKQQVGSGSSTQNRRSRPVPPRKRPTRVRRPSGDSNAGTPDMPEDLNQNK
jgi:type II secretory pathway component PulC